MSEEKSSLTVGELREKLDEFDDDDLVMFTARQVEIDEEVDDDDPEMTVSDKGYGVHYVEKHVLLGRLNLVYDETNEE